MKKYGFITDEFNPVTFNHLKTVFEAVKEYKLDKVFFIISNECKENPVSFTARMKMLKHYTSSWRKFEIFPESEEKFIFMFSNSSEIRLIQICEKNSDRKFNGVESFISEMEFGSERVRKADFSLIDKWQRRYISCNGLYQFSIAEAATGQHRWPHVKTVTQLAVEVALSCNIDIDKARTAALFHDCAKYFDEEMTDFYDSFYTTENELNYNFSVRHQSCGYALMRRYFKFRDKDVLNAVRHHTTGDYNNSLAKLIFIADKLDRGRGYDSEKEIEKCKVNLDSGFETVFQQQQDFLRKTGVIQ